MYPRSTDFRLSFEATGARLIRFDIIQFFNSCDYFPNPSDTPELIIVATRQAS
jgi:hypothetical protein